nr:unnamed protein product [Callosobruchus analis]
MGIKPLPIYRGYWCVEEDLQDDYVARPMPRNRFRLTSCMKAFIDEVKNNIQKHYKLDKYDYSRREPKKIPVPRYGDPGYMATKSHWPYFKSLLSLKNQFISRLSTGNLVGSQNELVAANMQSDTNSEDNRVETETIEETLDTVNVNTASCFLKKFESSTTPLSTRLHVRKISDVNILQFRNSVQDLVQRYAYGCN